MGEDAGLAGARAGEDQERAVGRRDGAGLLGVEPADDLLRAGLRAGLLGGLLLALPGAAAPRR